MELKEWIEIVATLIGDGLLVFFIGWFLEVRSRTKVARNQHTASIYSEYQRHIHEACYAINYMPFESDEEEGQSLRSFFIAIETKLVPCFAMHEEMLKPIRKYHVEMCDCANEFLEFKRNEDLLGMNKSINEIRACLYALSNECDRLIHRDK